MLCHLAWADVHTYIMYKTNLQNPHDHYANPHEIHYVVESAKLWYIMRISLPFGYLGPNSSSRHIHLPQ